MIPGANLFDVQRVADGLAGKAPRSVRLSVKDTAGRPVPDADVVLSREGKPHSWGRTDKEGALRLAPGDTDGLLTVSALGGGRKTMTITPDAAAALTIELPEAGAIVARISDEQGQPIACKVQFIGQGETRSPDFGPDSGEHAVKNLVYSHDGRFRRGWTPAPMT